MKHLMGFVLLAQLAQCPTADPTHGDGIYQVQHDGFDSSSCDTLVGENYDEAAPFSVDMGDPSGGISTTYTAEGSPELFNVMILDSGCSTADLFVGDAVYPGTRTGKDYRFEWTFFTNTATNQTHPDGWFFDDTFDSSVTETWTFTYDSDTKLFSGAHDRVIHDVQTYGEPDEWELGEGYEYTVPGFSQIPASNYLEATDDEFLGNINFPDQDDCAGDTCELSITTDCPLSTTFSAHRTGFAEEDSYQYASGAGQAGGS